MNKSLRKRLCWNCEGSVSIAEETCPFCGVSVVPAFLEGSTIEEATFSPPYSTRSDDPDLFDIPKSPYAMKEEKIVVPQENERQIPVVEEQEPEVDEFKRVVMSISLLLGGSVFFLFSMALVLFSTNGVLTLHWDGNVWFIYTLLAVPMLFLGWRSLMKLDNEA